MTNNIANTVSPDTQAILLLCGYFGGNQGDVPLKTAEYHKVARWLHQTQRRPADLLRPDVREWLQEFPSDGKIDWFRLTHLLERGIRLGFEREQWAKQNIWVISRADAQYPEHLRKQLGATAPVLLYGAGNQDLLKQPGVAIVGSRDADEESLEFTRQVSNQCTANRLVVISGGARGIDQAAVSSALEGGGDAVVVLAEGVAKMALTKAFRPHLASQHLVLISPFVPQARWNSGNAMGRNKIVYALSQKAVVVSSSTDGGTWEGATENLAANWVPLLVRNQGNKVPLGNQLLLTKGALVYTPTGLADEEKTPVTALENNEPVSLPEALITPSEEVGVLETSNLSPVQDVHRVAASRTETRKKELDNSLLISFDIPATEEISLQVTANQEEKEKKSAVSADNNHAPKDLFLTVWPSLAEAFSKQVSESELPVLSAAYGLQNVQFKTWLGRAIKEGLIKKTSKPTKYQRVK